MRRKDKIVLISFAILWPLTYWVGYKGYEVYCMWQILSDIEQNGLTFESHFEFEVEEDNGKLNLSYTATLLQYTFPPGTVCEQYDDMWGHENTCFTFPEDVDEFMSSDLVRETSDILSSDLSVDGLRTNPVVPAGAVIYGRASPRVSKWDDMIIYVHEPSARVWVRCWYRPPYE